MNICEWVIQLIMQIYFIDPNEEQHTLQTFLIVVKK